MAMGLRATTWVCVVRTMVDAMLGQRVGRIQVSIRIFFTYKLESWFTFCGVHVGFVSSQFNSQCVCVVGITGVTCTCPDGYDGDGVGPTGCRAISGGSGSCASSPCVYGACRVSHEAFVFSPVFLTSLTENSGFERSNKGQVITVRNVVAAR